MSSVAPVAAVQSGLRFEDFQVAQAFFKSDATARNQSLNYSVNFTPSGRVSRSQGRFVLLLGVSVTSDNGLFEADLQVRGLFSFDPGHDPEQLDKLFTLNTPALVFPYVRAYIGALTALSGLPTVLAPTYNLSGLAEPLRQAIEEVEEV